MNSKAFPTRDDSWTTGGRGNDNISVYARLIVPAHILGEGGADSLLGGGANDSIEGGAVRDLIRGRAGNDTLVGSVGSDTLFGGDGNDRMYGEELSSVVGMSSEDAFHGGAGNDSADLDENDTIDGIERRVERLFFYDDWGGSGSCSSDYSDVLLPGINGLELQEHDHVQPIKERWRCLRTIRCFKSLIALLGRCRGHLQPRHAGRDGERRRKLE